MSSEINELNLQQTARSVIAGALSFAALGGGTSASYAWLKNHPSATMAGLLGGVNSGLFGFAYFSTREYAIVPIFHSLRLSSASSSLTATNFHLRQLPESFIAGFLSGSAFSAFARGRRNLLRAGFTFALGTTGLQLLANEANLARVRYLAWDEARELAGQEVALPARATPASEKASDEEPRYLKPREPFANRSDRLIGDSYSWVKDKLSWASPVKKLEKDDYEERLRRNLEKVKEERENVKREMEQLK